MFATPATQSLAGQSCYQPSPTIPRTRPVNAPGSSMVSLCVYMFFTSLLNLIIYMMRSSHGQMSEAGCTGRGATIFEMILLTTFSARRTLLPPLVLLPIPLICPRLLSLVRNRPVNLQYLRTLLAVTFCPEVSICNYF